MVQARFHTTLRRYRIAADRSMGEVARSVGVSTVYYSDVENGRKPPFPRGKVDYGDLAKAVRAPLHELEELAAKDRGRVEIDLTGSSKAARRVAVTLARRLSENTLSADQVRRITRILEDR